MQQMTLMAILELNLRIINNRVMPRVVNGECWFPLGKVLHKYFDIVRRTDILQITNVHALPSSLNLTEPCADDLKTFLIEGFKYLWEHFR
jgi:hypothetical protein